MASTTPFINKKAVSIETAFLFDIKFY